MYRRPPRSTQVRSSAASDVYKRQAWMRSGGTVLYPSFPRGALETVEGDSAVFARWSKGDTGAGGFRRFQGDMEPYDLYGEFVRKQLQEMNSPVSYTHLRAHETVLELV